MTAPPGRHPALEHCVGQSPAIQAVISDLEDVSGTNCPVLLEGESGTGKELIAKIIHAISVNGSGPFEAVNCGAIPDTLIESELFGHVAGAFTGAQRAHKGVFERAKRGTVFLDEIGEMPPASQVKLLRVLQEGTFLPVGGEKLLSAEARVIAASNRDLQREVERGTFRRDLFYRLSVYPIRIPPLRERREDIPTLVEYFLDLHAAELGRPRPGMEATAIQRLMLYAWPGNVRELQNIIRTLLIEVRGGARISDRNVVAVFSRHRLQDESNGAEAVDADGGEGETPDAVREVGSWVVGQLRHYGFNVALTERMLIARQRVTMDRASVPVFSRSGITYYFEGEGIRALAEERWSLEAASLRISGKAELQGKVGRKLERVLAGAIEALRHGGKSPARRWSALRRSFPKLPREYEADLAKLAKEFERGRWS